VRLPGNGLALLLQCGPLAMTGEFKSNNVASISAVQKIENKREGVGGRGTRLALAQPRDERGDSPCRRIECEEQQRSGAVNS
jgi:hypothetical protein